jgi:FkbM family methyltransferase
MSVAQFPIFHPAMIHKIRSFVRKAGLAGLVSPWVSRWENWKLSKFGKMEAVRVSSDSARILYGDGHSLQMGPPRHYADMALSRHELPTLVALLNICSGFLDGKVAWDVGGNAGFYGALLSKLVGPSGKVHGFEPVPDTFKLMCANQQAAQCANVIPMNIALSDHDGVMPMSFNPSYNSVSSLEVNAGDATLEVRVASGDRLVESGECQVPVMVKMDIEGHELKALQGMRRTLGRPECRAIVCEIHFSILASRGESDPSGKARKLLQEAGFNHCRFISRSHLMATKERVG